MNLFNGRYLLLLASLLLTGAIAQAETTVEKIEINANLNGTPEKSTPVPAKRNFDLQTTVQPPSVKIFGRTVTPPSITVPVHVQASGNRCSALNMTNVNLRGNHLSFTLSLAAECSQINSTISGNLSETVCAHALTNYSLNFDLKEFFGVEVKRSTKQDLLVKFDQETLDKILTQLSEALTGTLPDNPQAQIVGLNFKTPYAAALSPATQNAFNYNMGCLAWNKGAMVQETLALVRSILSRPFTLSAGETDLSNVDALEFVSGQILHVQDGEEAHWDLVILE